MTRRFVPVAIALLTFTGAARSETLQDTGAPAAAYEDRASPPAVAENLDESGPPPPAAGGGAGRTPDRRTTARLVPNIGRSFIGVFSKETVAPLLIGGAATGLGSLLDEEAQEAISPGSAVENIGDTLGGPIVTGTVVMGLFVGGRFAEGPRFRAMTYDLLVGSVVNLGYTGLLKVTVGRERPDGSNNRSFPSGHASATFTLAVIAQKHYGWKLGAPMYAFAGFVSYSRLEKNVHWLSDVLAGATLGYISGITAVRQDGKPLDTRQPVVTISPLLGPHQMRGMEVAVTLR
jgi:membrane-associated phospholipid phosphatase